MNKLFELALVAVTFIVNFFKGRAVSIKSTCCIGRDNIEINNNEKEKTVSL